MSRERIYGVSNLRTTYKASGDLVQLGDPIELTIVFSFYECKSGGFPCLIRMMGPLSPGLKS